MECYSVDFSPDSTRLAAGIENGTVPIWDVTTGAEVLRLRGHTSCVNCVRFTRDGSRLITASCDGSVRLWDAVRGREERVLQRQKRPVYSLALRADGLVLATGDDDGIVNMYDMPRGVKLGAGSIGARRVDDLAFSRDGKLLAGACWDNVCICDAQGPSKLVKWTQVARPGLGPRTVGFKPHGALIAWAGASVALNLSDLSNPSLDFVLPCRNKSTVLALAFDSTGRRVTCGGESQIVEVWDIDARDESRSSMATQIGFRASHRALTGGWSARRVGTVPSASGRWTDRSNRSSFRPFWAPTISHLPRTILARCWGRQ